MSESLKAAAYAAGLTPEQKKKLDDFNKSLAVHKNLSNLPSDVASQVYNNLDPSQQQTLQNNFGNEDPALKPNRGWLGTAWHYTGGQVANALGYVGSKTLAGLGNASDAMTRAYRTAAISIDQDVSLGTAFRIANDKGDKVFSPGRIGDAKAKWGTEAVDVAMRIAAGEKPEDIFKSATPEQQKYLMLADPRQNNIPGIPADDIAAARANFQNTLDQVQAAKYSPGRQFANLITPGDVEGSGLFYKAVSGTVDAAYRILSDPLLLAGKAKRFYDASKYALTMATGGDRVADVFSKAPVINFWDQYGAKLDELQKAQSATVKNTEEIVRIKRDLQTLAPEYGPAVIQTLLKADIPVVNAKTAEAFFENTNQLDEMLKGSIGRRRIIIPRLDPLRKARIAAVTTGRQIRNIDAVGPKLVDDMWFGGATDADGIAKTIINGKEEFINQVKASTKPIDIARFSTAYIAQRIDRAKAKFTIAPLFRDDVFDVTAPDASSQIYRIARMVMPKRESTLLAQAFDSIEEVGKRKNVYYGLWGTVAEVRGLNTTQPGQQIVRYLTGKSQALYGLDDAFRDRGALPSDFTPLASAPSLQDLDRAAGRNGLFQKLMGVPNTQLAEQMVSAWSFLTLAGPRYALRNAGEDLMMNIAIGQSPWGVAKNRLLSTRINTFLAAAKKAETGGKLKWSENPLGIAMRLVNKKEVDNIATELTTLKTKFDDATKELVRLKRDLSKAKDPIDISDFEFKIKELEYVTRNGLVNETREIFARTLSQGRINRFRENLNLPPMAKDEIALLSEQMKYGDIENALGVVSESASNFATGATDYLSRAQNLVKSTGVRAHALEIKGLGNYAKKPGERAFVPKAISVQDEASLFTWMSRIGYYANDDLGKIAVANLDNQEEFLNLGRKWLQTKSGKQYLKDAQLSDEMSESRLLDLAFNRTKSHFVKRNGDINEDLLNKIRIKGKDGKWKVEGQLSIDDMPTVDDDIPFAIVGPTLVPAVEAQQLTSNVMTRGWSWLGLANARMSRQPLVLNEMVAIRKEMRKSGFEQKWIEAHVRGINPENTTGIAIATERAKRTLATAVEDRATSQILQYVDNPLVRTQIAFTSRNFARFYRATEDFYRRMYRVVRYNPEALVKAALTYEGVTHSGWVQKDDQGNDYFVYPGIAPVYNAVQDVLSRLGIADEFKTPFPIEFGAQLKMITPSLNPDSLVPTFSGPLAGASVKTITTLLGFADEKSADSLEGFLLGKYAVDRPVLSALLPAHINRLVGALDTDERNSQYASAWRKAVTYLEASGNGIPKRYDDEGMLLPPTSAEQEEYRLRVKNTTLGVLRVRFALGFLAPASPQVQLKSDMAQWISDNGRANWKQAFNNLLDKYPGDYDAAMAKWVELFPNQVPYTVTESERKSIAPLRYAEESGYFVDNNRDLFKDFPNAAAFLIPHKTGFSWDTYQLMRDMGMTYNKRVDDYLREVQTASDLQTYYKRKEAFESSLENSTVDFERTQLRKEFDAWKDVFFAARPLVREELGTTGSQKAANRLNTLDELENMLSQNIGIRKDVQEKLREMSKVYNQYKDEKANYDEFGGSQKLIKYLKDDTILKLRELAGYNENTQAVYDVLFGRLLGD
jgi:hypothetical protein